MGRRTTPLGLAVYARQGVPRYDLSQGEIERRVLAILAARGPLTLTQLRQATHSNIDQARLHGVIAALRDRGEVAVREERRYRTGRARVVVAPADGGRAG